MPTRTRLHTGWEYTQRANASFPDVRDAWRQCARFPTDVHAELEAAEVIANPHRGMNEWDVQWVSEADWAFKTTFTAASSGHTDLVFDGLDTYCTVLLNGKQVAQTDNMFRSHRVAIAPKEGTNTLELVFAAPWTAAKALEEQHGARTVWNGDGSRVYARKAQYGWGWDWGPTILTVGPWRDVWVEAFDFRLDNVRFDADVEGSGYDRAVLRVFTLDVVPEPSEAERDDLRVVYTLSGDDGVVHQSVHALDDLLDVDLQGKVQLWWPVRYGAQPLYELEIALLSPSGATLAAYASRVAFRHVKLIREPLPAITSDIFSDPGGESFVFQINGVRIFAAGANWIPGDTSLSRMSSQDYAKWVARLADGNMNMLRVWGGGVYEAEALYDACDALGVLVWQDFMFACGLYPSFDEFNASVKAEAEEAVRRLRVHPCVVIFAGNNEDYTLAESEGVADYDDKSGDYAGSKFPARHIYEIILPRVVARDSTIPYVRGSPYGGQTSNDPTTGDIHQWSVWHGAQEPWSAWPRLAGRFVSEFGMQAWPHTRTVKQFFDEPDTAETNAQWYPQSRVMTQHNKAAGFERRLALYLAENFRATEDLASVEGYAYATQLVQSEALAAAYRAWRRNWKGKGKEYTAGALAWQLNDCWPCVSWAIVDFYGRAKPAYFAIKRELEPVVVGLHRRETKTFDEGSNSRYTILHTLEIWAANATLREEKVTLEVVTYELGTIAPISRMRLDVTLPPNASTEVSNAPLPGQEPRHSEAVPPRPIVVSARVLDAGGKVLARTANWPEPYKFLTLPEPGLRLDVAGDEVTVSSTAPLKGLVLDAPEADLQFSDQALDVFPHDPQTVTARGLNGRKVTAQYLKNK